VAEKLKKKPALEVFRTRLQILNSLDPEVKYRWCIANFEGTLTADDTSSWSYTCYPNDLQGAKEEGVEFVEKVWWVEVCTMLLLGEMSVMLSLGGKSEYARLALRVRVRVLC
jgi:hypothetical protein